MNGFETLADWLRDELEADRAAAAEKSAGEWAITAVDTVVALGLLTRTMIYSVVYAINHAEPEAEIAFSLAAEPLKADWWDFGDRLQASLLGPIVVGFVIEAYGVGPMPVAYLALLVSNATVLAVDPLRVVAVEVWR